MSSIGWRWWAIVGVVALIASSAFGQVTLTRDTAGAGLTATHQPDAEGRPGHPGFECCAAARQS